MYSVEFKRLFDTLEKAKHMVLATSSNNRVSARTMSFVLVNEKLYFQTDKNFDKYQQIKDNPLAAVCWSNIQLEGRCRILGHAFEPQNHFFKEAYEKNHKGSYDAYTHLDNTEVIEITPILATVWGYDDGKPYREFFDFDIRNYRKEYYLPEVFK